MVGLVGVQSNQFPRALDIARPLRAAGIPVVIGGFHVSGCLAMLPDMQADLQQALDMGCSLFAGEAEDGRIDAVIRDAANGALKPIYNHMDDLPALEAAPTPFLPPQVLRRTIDHYASFDAGRGCPFQCSFCTIINVQGRKSRRRSADDVEQLIRAHYEHGIRWFFITDDNFARNKDWEAVFDRIILLRERDKIELKIVIQVDTLCHKIENFIAKAARAGVRKVFIGLENINPANLLAAKKRQNKITEYRTMMLAWKKAGVITYAGYILGFPNDTPESVREDIEIIKKELPIDILEFFCLTPLPGSEDHKVLSSKGIWMDPDMNKYDLEHVVTGHSRMSQAEWEQVYASAWKTYYTFEHMETVLRRAAVFDLKRLASLGPALHVRQDGRGRERASAAERLDPAQIPPRPPSRHAARIAARVLSALRQGVPGALRAGRDRYASARTHPPPRAEGSAALCLHGSGARRGDRRGDRDARAIQPQRGGARRGEAHAPDRRADARRQMQRRGSRSARDDDGRADADAAVEIDHILIVHADAAVGDEAADRARRVGAVDGVFAARQVSARRRPSGSSVSRPGSRPAMMACRA